MLRRIVPTSVGLGWIGCWLPIDSMLAANDRPRSAALRIRGICRVISSPWKARMRQSHRRLFPSRNARLGPAKLAVRPNAITLEPATGAAFPGQIFHSAYLGAHVE